MKNSRKVQFGLLAFLLAIGVVFGMSAFKKGETNPKHKSATLYWYKVTYGVPGHPDGYIVDADDLIATDEKENVESPCLPGDAKDCLRGFEEPISTFPSDGLGADKIMREN